MYFKKLVEFDSLMTVTKLKKFIWNDNEPVNYDRNEEKWPRTQTINTLWGSKCAELFLTSKHIYKERLDRIGNKPYLFQLSDEIAFDIDWRPDYKIAEAIYYAKYSVPRNLKIIKQKQTV